MKKARYALLAIAALVLPAATGCQKDPVTTEPDQSEHVSLWSDAEQIGAEMLAAGGWSAVAEDGSPIEAPPLRETPNFDFVTLIGREVLFGDVVHYEFRVRVGPGEYEQIGIHRVVREPRPYRPIRTARNVFLYHGDYKNFEGCFLPSSQSPQTPPALNFAIHLAQNDIDVWGIDTAWSLVPESEVAFAFMADWGMLRLVDHLDTGVLVARLVRSMTGSGHAKIILGGYSGGSPPCFALLDRETQRPPGLRNVGGIIPIDQGVTTDDPGFEQLCCDLVSLYQSRIDSGQYEDYNPLPMFGQPAQSDPEGPSQIPGFEGWTNLQAALALGTFPFFPPLPIHFLGGIFDEEGIPTGLQYADVDMFVDFIAAAPPYMPNAFLRDEYITNCSSYDVSWDDHLGQIQVPVLYVTAGGGFGPPGVQTLSLLGSSDVTQLHFTFHPPEDILLDFAHLDLFLANDAPTLVWQPIADWIVDHSGP